MREMSRIADLLAGQVALDTQVMVKGWVKTRRDSKAGLSFVQLHDGSCYASMQLVAHNTLPNYQQDIMRLTAGCAIEAAGRLVASQGKGQEYELIIDKLDVCGWVDNPETYPIQAKRHTLEYLRDVGHLRVRTNTIGAVTRIRHRLAMAIHEFFDKRGFFWVHTPIITASDCEGAGELFRVSQLDLLNLPRDADGQVDFSHDFFGKETFLTVSGQLNVESYCMAMSRVYTFGPTFRAENSNTSRHLAEFWMVEPEIAFADLADISQLAIDLLRACFEMVESSCMDDLTFFDKYVDKHCLERLTNWSQAVVTEIDYSDAINSLTAANVDFEFPVQWGLDLQSEHERYLCEQIAKGPVIVKNYPKAIKGFYMRINDDGKTVAAMDVLAPGIGEIIGGSQREERLAVLESRMQECGVNADDYQWYLDLRRYGSAPHAGFGLGFERLISYITGLANVRDVIPFPRTPGHADF